MIVVNFLGNIQGFFDTFSNTLGNFFGSLKETLDLLSDSITMPLDLVAYMPSLVGSAITIVVFTTVIKFILGR